jgi:hypothetical protein
MRRREFIGFLGGTVIARLCRSRNEEKKPLAPLVRGLFQDQGQSPIAF